MKQLVRKKRPVGGTARFMARGKNAVANVSDYTFQVHRRERLKPYDECFKKFKYNLFLTIN